MLKLTYNCKLNQKPLTRVKGIRKNVVTNVFEHIWKQAVALLSELLIMLISVKYAKLNHEMFISKVVKKVLHRFKLKIWHYIYIVLQLNIFSNEVVSSYYNSQLC